MKQLIFAAILFFIVSCGSGDSTNTSMDNNENNTSNKGNSPGSNIIGMDTMRMDTTSEKSETHMKH